MLVKRYAKRGNDDKKLLTAFRRFYIRTWRRDEVKENVVYSGLPRIQLYAIHFRSSPTIAVLRKTIHTIYLPVMADDARKKHYA